MLKRENQVKLPVLALVTKQVEALKASVELKNKPRQGCPIVLVEKTPHTNHRYPTSHVQGHVITHNNFASFKHESINVKYKQGGGGG
jgi:hypothetical protein